MSFSLRIAQKAAAISDGKDTFKGALSIKITYEKWGARFKAFRIFSKAAFSAILNNHTELCFYDIDVDGWTRGMDKLESNPNRESRES